MEGVDQSRAVLIYCTDGYFRSVNCMRELLRAVCKRKRIIAMGSLDTGGVPMAQLEARLEEALALMPKWGLDKEVAQWGHALPSASKLCWQLTRPSRSGLCSTVEFDAISSYQAIWFRKIAEHFLPRGHGPTYVRRHEITVAHHLKPLPPPRRRCKYHLYVSPNNVGAEELCHEMQKLMTDGAAARAGGGGDGSCKAKQRRRPRQQLLYLGGGGGKASGSGSDQPTAPFGVPKKLHEQMLECEQMLLYLSEDTWTSKARSEALAREVLAAMTAGVRLLLAHESPSWNTKTAVAQAVPFDAFFVCERGATPPQLLRSGIYQSIATAVRAEPLRKASLVQLVGEVGRADAPERKPNRKLCELQQAVVSKISLSNTGGVPSSKGPGHTGPLHMSKPHVPHMHAHTTARRGQAKHSDGKGATG